MWSNSSLHWALLQLRKPTGCDHWALLEKRKPTGCAQFILKLSPTSAEKTYGTGCDKFTLTLSPTLSPTSAEKNYGTGCDKFTLTPSPTLSPTSAEKTYWVWSIHLYTEPYLSWENLLGVINSSLQWALLQLRKPTECDQFIFTLSPTWAEKTYWVWSIHLYTETYFSWENLLGVINSSSHWALLLLEKP